MRLTSVPTTLGFHHLTNRFFNSSGSSSSFASHTFIFVTSRPEIDIRNVLDRLTSLRVSFHEQTGQKEDTAEHIKSIVHSGEDSIMKLWGPEDKDLVTQTLSEKANGM